MEHSDATVVFVAKGNEVIGFITFTEKVFESSKKLVRDLQKIRVGTHMISGATPKSVAAIAKQVGITTATGNLLPSGVIAILEKTEQRPLTVVGNPETDGAALTAADTSVSTHGHVSGLTDVSFDSYSPLMLANALKVSKKSFRRAQLAGLGGLMLALAVIVFAASGMGRPEYWAAAQIGVTVLVSLFAMAGGLKRNK